VEAAAYRMVADAVRAVAQHSSRAAVTVTIKNTDSALRVLLSTAVLDAATGELIVAAAQDRIAAAEGTVILTAANGQTTIEAIIPCAL
jgi:signal transduction histidine kinase